MSKDDRLCSAGNSKGRAGVVRDRGTARKKTAKTKAGPRREEEGYKG